MSDALSSQNVNSNSGTDILNLAEHRLKWLEKRQTVLAGNVANVNTPGYIPKDITPFQGVLKKHMSITLAQTEPGHMAASRGDVRTVYSGGIASPDKNEVDIEEELEKVANNNDQQRLASNTYSVYNSMFSIILGTER